MSEPAALDRDPALSARASTDALVERLGRLSAEAERAGLDAVLVGPGANLRYLVGHSVPSHERLTCLVIVPGASPRLLVPALERPGWDGVPTDALGVEAVTWLDGQDPHALLASLLPAAARVLGVDDDLPARHLLRVQAAVDGSRLRLAGPTISELRMRKSGDEVAALAAAGAAIDRVQARMGEWLWAGRTERDVAADIAAAIVQEGHATADFVIVGSGPSGASPHHEAGERTIREGDSVVVDIGGPTPAGYCSDCTRTYVVGAPVDRELETVHEVVRRAQQAGVAAARAGSSCDSVDAASRTVIEEAGYGEYFITRTGHGIGLEVHEEPYLVAGNERPLEPGMAFSVEPGIYLPGRFGVRIEDIVVVDDDGSPRRLNHFDTSLVRLAP
ncbi:M24 family metallopeptidase [Segeticoccus rhizosphaerae]|uniref:M24 family metallopeptidase n=2 Tax=Segeticoccus rhizosphaerae TaxID=1104777 RepID=UPI0010C0425E|nr:Xaa-Pro peptidase family protein [Ornithinicoccus soli]